MVERVREVKKEERGHTALSMPWKESKMGPLVVAFRFSSRCMVSLHGLVAWPRCMASLHGLAW